MAKRFVFAPLLDDAWTWKVTRLVCWSYKSKIASKTFGGCRIVGRFGGKNEGLSEFSIYFLETFWELSNFL